MSEAVHHIDVAGVMLSSCGFSPSASQQPPDDSSNFGIDTANAALGISAQDAQNTLLADIEARLAKEVLRLISPLGEFASRAQLIGKEIPESAQFCKLITGFLALSSLHVAYAIRQMADTPIFLDDGREYLAKLGLELHELVREVDLDGRRFLAVALIDKKSGEFGDTFGESNV